MPTYQNNKYYDFLPYFTITYNISYHGTLKTTTTTTTTSTEQ